MNLHAVYHRTDSEMCFPVSEDTVVVRLRTAKGDFPSVSLVWMDTYRSMRGDLTEYSLVMKRIASDELFDHYEAELSPVNNGVVYYFRLSDDLFYGGYSFSCAKPSREEQFFLCCMVSPADIFSVPSWARDAVVYQIFPDRFHPGTDVLSESWNGPVTRATKLGGTLRGITGKLDYLADLGINCLYMTPIFLSPSNHKYDTVDYFTIDPEFGTKGDLIELVNEAHRRGMRVILDAVFNHISSESPQFRDVTENGELSAYRNWFFVKKFPIEVKEFPDYATYGYHGNMPKLNTSNPEAREHLISSAEYWMHEAGIDGWRIDVAGEIDREFWREFRRRVKRVNPESLIVAELWGDASSWLLGDQFDTVMNYPLRAAVKGFLCEGLSARDFFDPLAMLRTGYRRAPWSILWNLVGSHDTPRILTLAKGDRPRARIAALIQMTLPGAPFIYYGDELAMEGGRDPDCRRGMAWESGDFAMRTYFKALIAARKKHAVLRYGQIAEISAPKGVLAYRLLYGDQEAVVIANVSDDPFECGIGGRWLDPVSGSLADGLSPVNQGEGFVFVRM